MLECYGDVLSKINRAHKHVNDFQAASAAFMQTDTHAIAIDFDPNSGHKIYRVTKVTPIPADIRLIAGDAIQNLRSALDYLAYGLILANNCQPTKYSCFPITELAPTTKEQKAAFARQVKGMRQDAIDTIMAIKPYKGGNDTLWRLHELNIRDKHRLLFAAGTSISGHGVAEHLPTGGISTFYVPLSGGSPLKKGDEFIVDPPDMKMYDDPKLLLEIALYEPGVAEGEILISFLRQSFRCVRKIAETFVF